MRAYLDLLRLPHVAGAIGSSIVGRLHESMLSFAVILLVSSQHGYATSGMVLAALGAGQTVGAPFWGRRVDRSRPEAVLLGTALAQASALVGLAVAGDSVGWFVVLAAVVGLVTPPLTPAVRACLPRLVPVERTSAAYALESTLQELIFVAGPLVAGAVAALLGARAAFLTAALLTVAGTAGYGAAVRRVVGRDAAVGVEGAGESLTASPPAGRGPMLRVLAGGAAFLVVLSVESVGLIGGVSGSAAAPAASWFLAATSVGSIVGGLVVGAHLRPDEGSRQRFATMALGLTPVLAGVLLPDPWKAPVLVLAAFGFGTTIAPVATTLFQQLSRAAPAARATEAFGWMGAAMGLGGVLGDGAGGWLVAHANPAVALAVACAVAGVAAAVVAGDDGPAGRWRQAGRKRSGSIGRATSNRSPSAPITPGMPVLTVAEPGRTCTT